MGPQTLCPPAAFTRTPNRRPPASRPPPSIQLISAPLAQHHKCIASAAPRWVVLANHLLAPSPRPAPSLALGRLPAPPPAPSSHSLPDPRNPWPLTTPPEPGGRRSARAAPGGGRPTRACRRNASPSPPLPKLTHEANGEGLVGADLAVNLHVPLHQNAHHLLVRQRVLCVSRGAARRASATTKKRPKTGVGRGWAPEEPGRVLGADRGSQAPRTTPSRAAARRGAACGRALRVRGEASRSHPTSWRTLRRLRSSSAMGIDSRPCASEGGGL